MSTTANRFTQMSAAPPDCATTSSQPEAVDRNIVFVTTRSAAAGVSQVVASRLEGTSTRQAPLVHPRAHEVRVAAPVGSQSVRVSPSQVTVPGVQALQRMASALQ